MEGFWRHNSKTKLKQTLGYSPQNKPQAVSLYEVGKIPAESMDAFLLAAAAVQRPQEVELLEYFDHAIALRDATTFLRAACPHRPLDIVRTESLKELRCLFL